MPQTSHKAGRKEAREKEKRGGKKRLLPVVPGLGAGERALPCQAHTDRPLSAGGGGVGGSGEGEGQERWIWKAGPDFLIGLNPTP